MKKAKKSISIILSMLMLISVFSIAPITANAATSGTTGDCTWDFNESTGVLTISGNGYMEENYRGASAFVSNFIERGIAPWRYYKIDTVVIEEGVKNIGQYAFYHPEADSIKKVIIPDSVESIGQNAFTYCYLENIDIKDSSVVSIGDYAFYDCSKLTSIDFPDTLTTIGKYAFCGCKKISKFSIPYSVKKIGEHAFLSHDSNLQEFYVSKNNENYSSLEGVLYNKDKTEIICYPAKKSDTNFTIPDSVIIISDSAFYNCKMLKSISLSNNTERIGESAFSQCTGITNILIPDGVVEIGDNSFSSCENLSGEFNIPYSIEYIGKDSFYYTNLSSIYVSKTNEKYSSENGVLYNKEKTELIFYPKNKSDMSFNIPNTVTKISAQAFRCCPKLSRVIIPDSVLEIGDCAFYECNNLNSIYISDNVEKIGGGAFWYTAYYDNENNWDSGALYIGNHLIHCNANLLSGFFSVKSGTKTIAGQAFSDCNELTGISIPNNVISIGDYAFCDCKQLKEIVIPEGLKIIGIGAFWDCIKLEKVFLSNDVEVIEDGAFVGCPSLQSIKIGDKIKEIGKRAFGYATGSSKSNGDFVISGYKNTVAKTYAEENGLKFIALDSSEENETTEAVTDSPAVTTTIESTEQPTVEPTESIQPVTEEPTEKPTEAPKSDEFKWNYDNYNFNNSAPDYFKLSTYRAQINNNYLNKLKSNLSNSEYQCVFEGDCFGNAWLDDYWGGSCYGMSSTSLLAKQGLLPYSNYKSGATKLNDLNIPKNDLELNSLITYYQMLQVKDVIQQQYRTVPNKTNENNIKNIISELDKNSTVLIGFQKAGWGGHAILATGYEYGSWTWDNITYQGCIKICDPNSSIGYNKNFNIYFNTNSYNWTIPAYSGIKSTSGAKFNYIGANVDEINNGGYLSGSDSNKITDYVARINAKEISNNCSVSKVTEKNGNYSVLHASPGEIVEDYVYVLGNESEGVKGYNLYDADSAYEINQNNAEKLHLNIDYKDCFMSGGSEAGESVIFDKKGYINVSGESAKYYMGMTFDDSYPTDWFTFMVSGDDSNNVSLQKVENGYILSADKLKNVTVKANNRENSATTSFSTGFNSVFIYEINEKVIGVKVDKDNDGNYDTDIDTIEPVTENTEPYTYSTEPVDTTPVVTEPTDTIPVVTDPIATTPDVTNPGEPIVTQPSNSTPSNPGIKVKKNNPMTVKAKAVKIKAKKLKKKAQKVKAITIKSAQGKVTCKIKSAKKNIKKFLKINSKGVITIKKWKKAKKGTYKIKVKVTAAGNANYYSKTVTKTVKIKIK